MVALVAEGLGNRDIASELNVTEHTVKNYLFRIFDKLGVSKRVEVVLYAYSAGNSLVSDTAIPVPNKTLAAGLSKPANGRAVGRMPSIPTA